MASAIPGAIQFKSTMVNYTRNHLRRFQFDVGLDSAVDLKAAQQLATETLRGMDSVLDQPEPSAFISSLGDSNVVVTIQGWLDQDRSSFVKVRSEAIRLVIRAMDAADYEMPEPIYRLRIDNAALQATGMKHADSASLRPPAPKPSGASQERESDTSRDDDLDRQIALERADLDSEDLLSSGGQSE